ncbi:MAG TPA: hypothetical protein VL357_12630 [Rariglobus sp.]|jgi:hypothetical protein|nr:hypothetical protein [Rariglobus sp.]
MAAALRAEAKIKKGIWVSLRDCATNVESFGAYDLTNYFSYQETGIPFLRGVNIKDGFANFTDVLYVDDAAHSLLKKSEVRQGMVLLTMSGSVGNATVALPSWRYPINSNQDIAKITAGPEISPFFLAAFLGSQFAKIQMERLPVGSVQQHIFLWMIEGIVVPRFSSKLETAISKVAAKAYELEATCVPSLAAAEQALLHALGLDAWQPPEPLTYVRRASEVAEAARFDSEFFAPRTLQLLAKLGAGGRTIRDIAPPRHEEFRAAGGPGDFDYIEIGALRGDGTVGSERLACADAPSRATWHVCGGDVVTSTVRPNRRLSALITPEQNGYVASSGFVVLQPQAVSAEVLLTYLRLPPVCEVMDLHTSASLYPTISETDLLKLPFPKLDQKTCDKVTAAVRAAHTARREAQELLARAQRAVEVAIEQGEPAALKFLAKNGEP